MNKTDDIDLFLTLHQHGWSTCWIYTNDKKVKLTISHVFGDPYFDFMNSLSQLIDRKNETVFFWYGEPGGERVKIQRIKDRQHIVNVKIDGFHASFGEDIKDFEETIEFEIKEKQLITIVYYQLKKIDNLLKEKSFATNRAANFPFKDFVRFENLVTDYLQQEKRV